jgi:hypothetical protein
MVDPFSPIFPHCEGDAADLRFQPCAAGHAFIRTSSIKARSLTSHHIFSLPHAVAVKRAGSETQLRRLVA